MAAERLAPVDLRGEPGRAICDFVGEAGRSRLSREFEEVGDRIWAGRTWPASVPCAARTRRFWSMFSSSFSLSPASALLEIELARLDIERWRILL